jgi:flagellar biosynthetic protein FliR
LVFSLVLIRVSGIVIGAPVFGSSDIPVQIRALLAFTLTLLIMPSQWMVQITEPQNLVEYAVLVVSELIIGVSIGLAISIFFSGVAVAGEVIGQTGGLSASQIFDPISGTQSPLLSRAMNYLAVAVFACVGGLRAILTSLLYTFETLPLGSGTMTDSIAEMFLKLLSISFSLSLRISAPVIVAVLVSMLVLGLLGKTLPQLNLMSIGFGINSMVMFCVLMLSVGAGIWCFQDRIADCFCIIFEGLHCPIDVNYLLN